MTTLEETTALFSGLVFSENQELPLYIKDKQGGGQCVLTEKT